MLWLIDAYMRHSASMSYYAINTTTQLIQRYIPRETLFFLPFPSSVHLEIKISRSVFLSGYFNKTKSTRMYTISTKSSSRKKYFDVNPSHRFKTGYDCPYIRISPYVEF